MHLTAVFLLLLQLQLHSSKNYYLFLYVCLHVHVHINSRQCTYLDIVKAKILLQFNLSASASLSVGSFVFQDVDLLVLKYQ